MRDASKATQEKLAHYREYWSGDSRDGALVDGDGYHYFAMTSGGDIVKAYEYYETDDGIEVASALPEMLKVNWFKDLGFDDLETLDAVAETEFDYIEELASGS